MENKRTERLTLGLIPIISDSLDFSTVIFHVDFCVPAYIVRISKRHSGKDVRKSVDKVLSVFPKFTLQ
jgi:hypothetical protein